MQLSHLSIFCCPTCRQPLTLSHGDGHTGMVVCAQGHTFAITRGVLDLLGVAQPQSMAAWVNEFAITAWLYERIWRPYALTLMSGTTFPYTRELSWLCGNVPSTCHTIVDVACSNGLYARALAQAHPQATIIGIDRAMPMLVEAVARANAAHLPISYVRADARALPLGTAGIDAVVVGGSWNEMEEMPRVLSEMARITRPHGRMVAMALTQSTRRLGATIQRLLSGGGTQFFDPTALTTQLHEAGWHLDEATVTGVVWQGVASRTEHCHGQS
ncbi:MAG: class I SAM-dependent methyltransferase [Roseiflexaceae bacterium]